ncbi:MAG: peptide chain release factor N(5)-glutamine methyltransferase [Epsilonproteobacteria bacterium]|nr:peptide chain release factor N(5)-glutamine methyltransferase [Campylobacterota bacterium]
MTATLATVVAQLQQQLPAEQEAWWLLEKVTGTSKAKLLANKSFQLTHEQTKLLEKLVDERVNEKKPLQYILGSVPFCNLDIITRPPVLIPRPETEEWVSWLITQLDPIKNEPLHILDLCTGSGCIALALSKALPNANVTGVDITSHAIELARQNKQHNNIGNCTFIQSDLYTHLQNDITFDLIVSNPPYLSEHEWQGLEQDVTQWEDKTAFVANAGGLGIYNNIIEQAHNYLKKNSVLQSHTIPQLVLELGTNAKAVQKTLETAALSNITIYKDLQGKDRWISACI